MGGDDHKEKTTRMVLKVDLQCPCCYKKAKKILCKMPQVRDQAYDEKANTITIVVVCCSPERIHDKLYCKGGKTIKNILIKRVRINLDDNIYYEPEEKVKEPKKLKNKAKEPKKPTVIDKPKDKPKDSEKPKEGAIVAMVATLWISEPMMMMPLVQRYSPAMPGCGCPCYQYYRTPVLPQPAPYYGYGPGPDPSSFGYVNNDYYYEENGQGCTIM